MYRPLVDDDDEMNDRLAELKGVASVPLGDVEIGGVGAPNAQSAFMNAFFDEVQDVKKAMSTIRYNIRQIEQNHGECLTAISAEQGRASTDRLDELMKATNATATQARNEDQAGGSSRPLLLG